MKQTWKQIGSLLMAVCMVFTLLPAMAFAQVQDFGAPLGASGISLMGGGTVTGSLSIGGSVAAADLTVNSSGSSGRVSWAWDATTATLTLENNGTSITPGTIEFNTAGDVTITVPSGKTADVAAIAHMYMDAGKLTINGGGTLNVLNDEQNVVTIETESDLEIANVTVNVMSTQMWGHGVSVSGSFTMNSAALNIDATGDSSVGLRSNGNINISGDTLNVISTGAGLITVTGNIQVNDGSVDVTCTGADRAIEAAGTVLVSGGSLTAKGNGAWGAIYSLGVTVSGGTLTTGENGVNGDISGNVTVNQTVGTANVTINGDIDSGSGAGNLSVSEGTVTVTGNVAGSLSVSGGTSTVTGYVAGDLTVSDGAATVVGGVGGSTANLTGGTVWVEGAKLFPVDPTYTATLNILYNGVVYSEDTAGYILKLSTNEAIAINMEGTGATRTASVPNGTWKVYIGQIGGDNENAYVTITINDSGASAQMDWYRFEYLATPQGAATGGKIDLTINGESGSGGTAQDYWDLIKGDKIILTASGTGAEDYAYAWSGTHGETPISGTGNSYVIEYLQGRVNIVCTITGSSGKTDVTNSFTDPNFLAAVRASLGMTDDVRLYNEDLAGVETLRVANKSIKSLAGIEHFTGLKYLYCSGNELTALDVSHNTKLLELYCYDNELTALDLSSNEELRRLQCSDNELTSLDVSDNTELITLQCNNNKLITLTINNTTLTFLNCSYNELETLNVSAASALKELYCHRNQLIALDVSGNSGLEKLNCSRNDLPNEDAVTGRNAGLYFTFSPQNSDRPAAPTVTGAYSLDGDGTYCNGEELWLAVKFNKRVWVNSTEGTPYINLRIGSETKPAYCDFQGTDDTLYFFYTIESSDLDEDGIEWLSPIELNSGTITLADIDFDDVNAELTFAPPADTSGILVKGSLPRPTFSISGTIKDEETGNGIPGAVVDLYIQSLTINDPYSKLGDTIADASGHYSFVGLSSYATYVVEARANGYEEQGNDYALVNMGRADETGKDIVLRKSGSGGSTPIEITGFEPIPDENVGKAGSAICANADEVRNLLQSCYPYAIAAHTDPPALWLITGWEDTDGYNPAVAGSYTFTATLGTVPSGYANSAGHTAAVEVVVSQADNGNGGGSSSGGSTTTPSAPPAAPNSATPTPSVSGSTATTTVTTTTDTTGMAAASVPAVQVDSALKLAQDAAAKSGNAPKIEIKVEAPANAAVVETAVPQAAMTAIASGKLQDMTLSSPVANLTFDGAALNTIAGAAAGDVKFSATKVDKADLPAAVQTLLGTRPVYEFSITSGDKTISQFNGNVTVAVPYQLGTGENPNAVIISYINASGNLEIVTNGRYDAATGTVVFTTDHFSRYAIGYNKIDFTDVTDSAWYVDAVTFLAARGITGGTTPTTFSPDATLTRGQFITLLMRAYNIAADENTANNFSDAGSTYYSGYLATAKRLGIAGGVGGNKFAPEQSITRQEMFTILYKALQTLDKLPAGDSGKTLKDFTDSGSVADLATEAMTALTKSGTVAGSAGKLDPTVGSTRAQMAQLLYNLLGK